jgi:hypothetical protein
MSRPCRTCCRDGKGGARKLWGEVVASVVDEPSVDSGRRARRVAAVEVLAEHTYGVPRLLEVLGKVPASPNGNADATCDMQHTTRDVHNTVCAAPPHVPRRTAPFGTIRWHSPRYVRMFGTDRHWPTDRINGSIGAQTGPVRSVQRCLSSDCAATLRRRGAHHSA